MRPLFVFSDVTVDGFMAGPDNDLGFLVDDSRLEEELTGLMLSTMVAELLTPLLLSRFGYRMVFAAGLVLLGTPAFALGFAPTLVSILAVCLARGLGLGIVPVVGGALVAELVPPERRGEGLGLYGVAVGVPFVVALPLGVWLAETFGYSPVFAAGGLAALAGLAAIPGLPGRSWRPGRTVGVLDALRNTSLLGPLAVFFFVVMSAGIVVTFVPRMRHPAGGRSEPSNASREGAADHHHATTEQGLFLDASPDAERGSRHALMTSVISNSRRTSLPDTRHGSIRYWKQTPRIKPGAEPCRISLCSLT